MTENSGRCESEFRSRIFLTKRASMLLAPKQNKSFIARQSISQKSNKEVHIYIFISAEVTDDSWSTVLRTRREYLEYSAMDPTSGDQGAVVTKENKLNKIEKNFANLNK